MWGYKGSAPCPLGPKVDVPVQVQSSHWIRWCHVATASDLSLSLSLPNTAFISPSQLTFQRTDPTKTPAHKSPSQSISWEPDLRSPLRNRSPQKLCQRLLNPSQSLLPSFLSLPTNIVTLKQWLSFRSHGFYVGWLLLTPQFGWLSFSFPLRVLHGFPTSNCLGASPVAQVVKNPTTRRETWVQSIGWEDPLEKGKATHSSILAWRIPWIVYSMGSKRVGHNWVTFTFSMAFRQSFCARPSVEQFYEDLQDLLELTLKKHILFIVGDWMQKKEVKRYLE